IEKVCEDVSAPPLAVPPSLCSAIVTWATPVAPAAGAYVSVPVITSIAGCEENNALLLLLTVTVSTSFDSPAGPATRFEMKPGTVCGPEFFGSCCGGPAIVTLGAALT